MTQTEVQVADSDAAHTATFGRQDAAPSADSMGVHLLREAAALNHVVARLASLFPELRVEAIERSVFRIYAQFESSRIRDFVPILVERMTRDELRAD